MKQLGQARRGKHGRIASSTGPSIRIQPPQPPWIAESCLLHSLTAVKSVRIETNGGKNSIVHSLTQPARAIRRQPHRTIGGPPVVRQAAQDLSCNRAGVVPRGMTPAGCIDRMAMMAHVARGRLGARVASVWLFTTEAKMFHQPVVPRFTALGVTGGMEAETGALTVTIAVWALGWRRARKAVEHAAWTDLVVSMILHLGAGDSTAAKTWGRTRRSTRVATGLRR